MPPIHIINDFSEEIKRGEMVFRISSYALDDEDYSHGSDFSVLTTYEKAKQLLLTHRYNALLYVVDLPLLLSYLYGCLNYGENYVHNRVFIFYVRSLGSREEKKWFIVSPYVNSERI